MPPRKSIRCPGYVDAHGRDVTCTVVTAVPNGYRGMTLTEDAAGEAHGFRCKAHIYRPVGGIVWTPEVRPQRPHPSPLEQAKARKDMAAYEERARHQDKLNRAVSAAIAASLRGTEDAA